MALFVHRLLELICSEKQLVIWLIAPNIYALRGNRKKPEELSYSIYLLSKRQDNNCLAELKR